MLHKPTPRVTYPYSLEEARKKCLEARAKGIPTYDSLSAAEYSESDWGLEESRSAIAANYSTDGWNVLYSGYERVGRLYKVRTVAIRATEGLIAQL